MVVSALAQSGNRLLRDLTRSDQSMIEAHMIVATHAAGATLMHTGGMIDDVYFPESGIVVIEEPTRAGGHVEVALVGNEGMIGWPALFGIGNVAQRAVVQGRGVMLQRIAAPVLLAACQASETLGAALLNFVQAIMIQMSRSVVTHLRCSLDQRVARWLLMRHDRIVGDQIVASHDEIAAGLSARRASVTNRLHIIEGERLISSRRGRVVILDRAGLEVFAGDAFGVAEAGYRRLLGGFGKSG